MTRTALLLALIAALLVPAPAEAASPFSRVQKQLNRLHCDAGPADGRRGEHTRSALIRFQSRHGLRANGDLTKATRKTLFSKKAERCDRRPTPKGSGEGRRIVISQGQNWVWLVAASGKVVAQGGMIDNTRVLRRGTYRTRSYCGRAGRIPHNSDYGGRLWLDNFVRFAPCGVGFHRIPRHKNGGAQLHPDYLLGTNLRESHGCIRLSRSMSDQVWRFTSQSAVVRVVS